MVCDKIDFICKIGLLGEPRGVTTFFTLFLSVAIIVVALIIIITLIKYGKLSKAYKLKMAKE